MDHEKPKQVLDLWFHLRAACTGRKLDALRMPLPLGEGLATPLSTSCENATRTSQCAAFEDDEGCTCFCVWLNLR